ncbi:Short-chain dehydrogenase/reductase SDR [Penicillium concentricum]|uniref:Short-chain dehydrogenase/reductase SDR n=1 Tax=Penicillium concentricum TaxID=293559 RepID=A0A9W9SBG9_9EURO|nr:Short-chain dehydrogenase/reductase SDR [Penicillium concentricum]KAJ5375571.1 Short-chain dehydrogenase/reductase SDR [Penicillium concentricum]
MAPRLLNKICLITGTGGGMGRAAALKFAQEGAKIVGCDINIVTDAATVKAVRELGGEMISLAPCDLTKRENCEQLVNLAIKTYGRIDALYNNAAMAYMSWLDEAKDDDWYKTIDQELNLVYLLTRVAWPHLKKSGASIINVGSSNGWIAIRPVPAIAHTAAKGGVIAMTRQLAMEGREHGIRANSISPGLIETLQTAPLLVDPEWTANVMQKIMLGRSGQPEEIAAVASFLASDESSYITAADIRVDGGMTAW